MPGTVTFSVAVLPGDGAEDVFRDSVQNLQLHDLDDCFVTVFHMGESYALLSGEAIPGAHTATNSALSAYLTRRLIEGGAHLDFEVKIDEATTTAGPDPRESRVPGIFPVYPFI